MLNTAVSEATAGEIHRAADFLKAARMVRLGKRSIVVPNPAHANDGALIDVPQRRIRKYGKCLSLLTDALTDYKERWLRWRTVYRAKASAATRHHLPPICLESEKQIPDKSDEAPSRSPSPKQLSFS